MKLALALVAAMWFVWWLFVPPSHEIYEDDWACTRQAQFRLKFFPEITRTACVQWTRRESI